MNSSRIKDIVKQWYAKLHFEEKFDIEFNKLVEETPPSEYTDTEHYNLNSEDGGKNLLYALYMCEGLSHKYEEMHISEEILLDTLSDIVVWCKEWSRIKGRLFLGELSWLAHHLTGRLFMLGRLQFNFDRSKENIAELNLKEGDPLIGVHIQAGSKLEIEECKRSFEMAREFFAKYFPEYQYEYFVCHSWLLDDTLKEILPASSNIIRFGDMFTKTSAIEHDIIVRYVFGWDAKVSQVQNLPCNTALAKNVRRYIEEGKSFHITTGYIKR